MSIAKTKVAMAAAAAIAIGIGGPVAYWFISQALDRAFGLRPFAVYPVSLIVAAAAFLIGIFWAFWSYSYLVFVGKGLPLEVFGRALHPTSALVTTGPYAYTRNPLVLGLSFVLLGVAFLGGSIAGLVLVPLVAALFALYLFAFEEKALVERFGADYEEYRRNVPMLLPRLTPYIHEPAAAVQS